ncbi:MAG TPA: hypothetical protein PKA37_14325, partial [Planctomycetota bacterium]|nr:hypothetical protein [Planctomycetota bacterium]
DFDPASPEVNNIGPLANPPVVLGSAPVSLAVAPGTNSLFVSGFGGAGFAGRIDNPLAVGAVTYTPVTGFSLANAWRSTLSPNGDRVAIASGSPFQLRILDLNTLAVQATLPLGMSDATNIVWH